MKKLFDKKIILKLIASAVATVIFASGFSIPVQADTKTYKVILRAGEHGEFSLGDMPTNVFGDVISSDFSAKKMVFEVTEGGALLIQSTTAIVDIVNTQYQGKYFVQDESIYLQTVTRNEEYVIQYGRLVNGVEYKIEYVDNVTGVPIADPKFAWGNDTEYTPEINAKNISNYALANGSPQKLKLDKNATFNTITFRYNSTLTGGTTTNTTYQTADGGTETINETQQNPIYQAVPGVAPAAAVATTGGTGGGAGATIIGEEETALDATIPEEDTEDEAAQGDTEATEDTQETEGTTIEEEEVALAPNANQPVNVAAVAAVMLGGIAVVLAVIWIIARRRIAGIDDQDDNDQNDKMNK